MNYGNLVYNCFFEWFDSFRKIWIFEMYVCICGVFCVINWSFKCVYQILRIFLYI